MVYHSHIAVASLQQFLLKANNFYKNINTALKAKEFLLQPNASSMCLFLAINYKGLHI